NFSTAGQSPSPLPSALGHPNSDSDPGAIALIHHWRLSQHGRTYERSAGFLVAELVERFCQATINTGRWMKELVQAVKRSPNIGRPLFDSALVASSCKTSQRSARRPFSILTISALCWL